MTAQLEKKARVERATDLLLGGVNMRTAKRILIAEYGVDRSTAHRYVVEAELATRSYDPDLDGLASAATAEALIVLSEDRALKAVINGEPQLALQYEKVIAAVRTRTGLMGQLAKGATP